MKDKDLKKRNTEHVFDRVVSILEQARKNVVRAVNSNMVLAYWLIGREIVEEIQNGKNRAEYGKQVLSELSDKLTQKYGKGFSVPNLQNFRKFYEAFSRRIEISYPLGTIFDSKILNQYPLGTKSEKDRPLCDEFKNPFDPNISWSHYRALMRVNNEKARLFYEQETVECGWSKRDLERHIHSQYYERMLKSQQPELMKKEAKSLSSKHNLSTDMLKSPYILEFLDLPDNSALHETQLESAIITHLQSFLLELGKGFAFVSRQKRLQFEDKNLYVDLVFYNCILKCYLLIDLKISELSHKDVGQMDGYIRIFDDLSTADDDNPTIGLILCADKNESIAKYSVLSERKQIFASKYMLYLPTEKELEIEIKKERLLIEDYLQQKPNLPEDSNE